MTTNYNGTSIGLEYDAAAGTWGFKNIAQDFVDTNTFSTADPSFEYAPTTPTTPTTPEPEPDPCPAGYVYDESLKQCVPDPNYQNPFIQQGGKDDNRPDNSVYIPSNETKENWIKNANVIIPAGQEGAGKTGYQNFIDNLDDRGWIKKENGKMIFKKDNIGSAIGQAGLNRVGMTGEVEAKTNKIIKDLQRMGGINAQINMDEDGNIDFSSELELANNPDTFATYNYDGTDLFGGNYTGFTTPATNPLGVKTFATWDDYMAAIMQPFTSTSTEIKKTKVSAGDRMDAEMAIKEKERIELEKEKEKLKQEQIKTEKLKVDNFQPGEDTKREQQRKEDYKNMISDTYGLSDDFSNKSYVRNQAGQISSKPKSFKKDTERTPSNKSYTQSKIEQAAKTGRYSGF